MDIVIIKLGLMHVHNFHYRLENSVDNSSLRQNDDRKVDVLGLDEIQVTNYKLRVIVLTSCIYWINELLYLHKVPVFSYKSHELLFIAQITS